MAVHPSTRPPVNRHTGGLENKYDKAAQIATVNRHTGGLEK